MNYILRKYHLLSLFIAFIGLGANVSAQLNPEHLKSRTEEVDFRTKTEQVIENLDLSEVTSGYLMDLGYDMGDYPKYNGNEKSPAVSFPNWIQLYATLYGANLTEERKLPEPYETFMDDDLNQTYSYVVGIDQTYHRLDRKAVEKGLVESRNDKLYDVAGKSQSPFVEDKLHSFAIALEKSDQLQHKFLFKKEFFFTDNFNEIEHISVDFGDEQGLRTLVIDKPVKVDYRSYGTKEIRFITNYKDGTKRYGTANLRIINPQEETEGPNQARYDRGNPDAIVNITAVQPYFDQEQGALVYGGATLDIFYGCNKTQLTKPIVLVEGFNPGFGGWDNLESNGFINGIRSAGELELALENHDYDIVYVDFNDGGTWIQENAFALMEVLNYLNDELANNNSNEEIVVIGESMGGLVARYALAYMEQQAMDHNVRKFISFDSPQQGANIPLGFQVMLEHVANVRLFALGPKLKDVAYDGTNFPLRDVEEVLNLPATRQMVIYHAYNPYTRLLFQTELAALGYPQNCENVAVSNGSYNGIGQANDQGNLITPSSQLFGLIGGNITFFPWWAQPILISHGAITFATFDVRALPFYGVNDVPLYSGVLFQTILGVPVVFAAKYTDISHVRPFDSAPGGYDGEVGGFPIGTNYAGRFCFIPTVSSTDINPAVWGFDPNYAVGLNNPNSAFDNYTGVHYSPILGLNSEYHVDYTDLNAPFFEAEIVGDAVPNVLNGANEEFNIGFNPNYYVNNTIATSIIIGNGGVLGVNLDQGLGLLPNNNPYPIPNNNVVVNVKGTDCLDNVDIDVIGGGEVRIGDVDGNRTATMILENGSLLRVTAAATLDIDANSTLTVRDGAALRIDQGATVNLFANSTIIIEDGGELIIEGQPVINLVERTSVIEIAGGLNLMTGAEFSPFGEGHVVFNDPEVTWRANCIIDFSMQQRHFVGFELLPNTDLVLNNVNNGHFIINTGRVLLGNNSILDLGSAFVEIINTDVFVTGGEYETIMLQGYNSTIDNCVFKGGRIGLTVDNTVGTNRFTMTNSEILNGDYGINLMGGGADLSDIYINEMDAIGFLHVLATQPTTLTRCEIVNCNEGINYSGGAIAPLHLEEPLIWANQTGVFVTGGTTLTGHCGSIAQNTHFGIVAGVHTTLDLSNDSKLSVLDNEISIGVNRAYYLNFDNGNNDFIPSTEMIEHVIYGEMRESVACYAADPTLEYPLPAVGNRWNSRGPQAKGKSLSDYVDYELLDENGVSVQIQGTQTVVPTVCGPQAPVVGGCEPFCEISVMSGNCGNCEKINTAHFNNVKLNEAMKDAVLTMEKYNSTGTGDDLLALEKMNEILLYPYSNINLNEGKILDFGYKKMKQAFGFACKSGEISCDKNDHLPNLSAPAQKVLEVVLMWKKDGSGGGTGPFNGPRLRGGPCDPSAERTGFDGGHLYKAIGLNALARDAYNVVADNATDQEVVELARHWECISNTDLLYEEGMITKEERSTLRGTCTDLLVQSQKFLTSSSNTKDQTVFSPNESKGTKITNVRFAPNPATEQLEIYFDLSQGMNTGIEIRTTTGKEVMVVEDSMLRSEGSNSILVDVSELTPGMYYVFINAGTDLITEKLVISK